MTDATHEPEVAPTTDDHGAPGQQSPADAGTVETTSQAASDPVPEFVLMHVGAVLFELPSPNPIFSMVEQAVPYRQIDIPVGLPEAQSLALAIHGVEGLRPSTHELFAATLRAMHAEIVALRITSYERGVFYAELDLMTPKGRVVLDCRPTDGVILALRQAVVAPILCAVGVFDAVTS